MSIPTNVLKDALGVLSATEFRVFVAICAQSQPWNNGTAKMTRSVIREYHLGSTRVVTSALRKLLASDFIRRTRRSRQQVCAMYAVRHVPLNQHALCKEGVSATTWEALVEESSATNRGSAGVRPHGTRCCDHRGRTEPENVSSARPQGNRNPPFSTTSARPLGTQSKNLPPPTANKQRAAGVSTEVLMAPARLSDGGTPAVQQPVPTPSPQPDNTAAIRQLLEVGHSPGDIVRVLSGRGVTWDDVAAITATRHHPHP